MADVPLFSAQDLNKTFGIKTLFEGITFSVVPGEKVALIGPNGSGKSTLLKMVAGLEHPDHGKLYVRKDLRSAYVPQQDQFNEKLSVNEILIEALVATGHEEFEIEGKVASTLGKAGFKDKDTIVSTLSGGWKKRLAILRGMIVEPELLLLDEPTNHLDIAGVLWLEELLSRSSTALIFVSHDRYFIARLAERVFEINRQYPQGFFSANGDYGDFLEARALHLAGLKQSQETLANKVRREVAWLRQGAKARTTKSKYRKTEALNLVEDLKNSQYKDQRAQLEFSSSNRKSRDLIKVENASKSFENKKLFKDISITLSPGVRLGIVGPNGSGKTTFVKTLLGEIKADQGKVIRAPNLLVKFFDQARQNLDKSTTLKKALAPSGGDSVIFNSNPMHVVTWAKRFLFSNEQLSVPVSKLSGGEQARLLLAQLMLQESDIILFDEPTNDLDISTLEVLEESFCEYPGAIVLVTHDRYLLDRTATTILGLSDEGGAFYSSYLQWEAAYQRSSEVSPELNLKKSDKASPKPTALTPSNKLTYDERKELRGIESKIIKAEKELESLNQDMNIKNNEGDATALHKSCEAVAKQQELVETLFARWQELEAREKDS